VLADGRQYADEGVDSALHRLAAEGLISPTGRNVDASTGEPLFTTATTTASRPPAPDESFERDYAAWARLLDQATNMTV
jgi:hypothetical protein